MVEQRADDPQIRVVGFKEERPRLVGSVQDRGVILLMMGGQRSHMAVTKIIRMDSNIPIISARKCELWSDLVFF